MNGNSINILQAAIVDDFATVFCDVSCAIYAGQFNAAAVRQVRIKTPSLLVDFESATEDMDPGTGQIDLKCKFTAYAVTRLANDIGARNQDSQALALAALVRLKYNRFGLSGVSVPTDIKLTLINHSFFVANALGVTAVSWTQIVRIGESSWMGGVTPVEVWLGLSPEIGVPFVDKYWEIT